MNNWNFILCLILVVPVAVRGYTSDDCTQDTVGQPVCISCKYVGICESKDGNSTAVERCGEYEYCVNGECTTEVPAGCECGFNDTKCKEDPYGDGSAYIDCTNSFFNSFHPLCPDGVSAVMNNNYCGCADSATCDQDVLGADTCTIDGVTQGTYYLGPIYLNDGCGEFYFCQEKGDDAELTGIKCDGNQCFSTETCSCAVPESPTTVPTTTSTLPPPIIKCPACGKLPDPEDESKYYTCVPYTQPALITTEKDCPYGTFFDSSVCKCRVYDDVDCPDSSCPFVGYWHTQECDDYVECERGVLFECPNEGYCWDQEACGCVPEDATSPTLECPTIPACGLYQVNEHDFLHCVDIHGDLVDPPILDSCGENSYFLNETCECLDCTTCVADPYAAADDCGSYYKCNQGRLAYWPCPIGLCYNPYTCECGPSDSCTTCDLYAQPFDTTGQCYRSCAAPWSDYQCCPDDLIFDESECRCRSPYPGSSADESGDGSGSTMTAATIGPASTLKASDTEEKDDYIFGDLH